MGLLDWLIGKKPSPNVEVSSKSNLSTSGQGKFTEIGNTEPVCPYCNHRFEHMPQRKKKCPKCGKFIYSRTRPLDNNKVLLREDQIEDLERQWGNQSGNNVLNFNLVNSHAVALGKKYKEILIKKGGSDITEIGNDGIAHRVFSPWLTEVSPTDRERIADIITSAIETGKPLKAVAKELMKIPAMSGKDTERIAYQETKFLYTAGTMNRFASEHIQQGIWKTIDPAEKEHTDLNGQVFDLDDPIWNMLYLDGCSCYCEPKIR